MDFIHFQTLLDKHFGFSALVSNSLFGRPGVRKTIDDINAICNRVFRQTIEESRTDFGAHSSFTILACHMKRIRYIEGGDNIERTQRTLGKVEFNSKFIDQLYREDLFTPPPGSLSGLPFINTYSLNRLTKRKIVQQGAILIGTDNRWLSEKRYCFELVAKKYVAFAAVNDDPKIMAYDAEDNRVFLLRLCVRGFWGISDDFVTIAARSLSDLKLVCSAIGRCSPPGNFPNQQVPMVVISLGFCGYTADSYLRQLGLRMESQTEPWIVIYYFRNVLMEAGDLNDFFINRTTYESIFEAVPLLSKFDIQTVREPWAFALTGVGRVLNLPTDRNMEFQMNIPVMEYIRFSYQLNRNPGAQLTIWEVASRLETWHTGIVNSGFFYNQLREEQSIQEIKRQVTHW